jgi:hypothetical protein
MIKRVELLRTIGGPDVRFGSEADICAAKSDARESGFPQKAMSALPLKPDMCGAPSDVG